MVELGELLGNGRGRAAQPLTVERRRALTLADLMAPSAAPQSISPLKALRHQHHKLAQLLASGKRLEEVCLISGYSVSYVSNLKNDPAFAGLIAHYEQQVDQIFVDVQERLKEVGIHTVEELQSRLAESPEKFSSRELMELAELCFDRAGFGKSHTVNNNVAVLSLGDLERVKRAISSSGQIRDISEHAGSQRSLISGTLIEGNAQGEIHSSTEEGPHLSEEGRKEALS